MHGLDFKHRYNTDFPFEHYTAGEQSTYLRKVRPFSTLKKDPLTPGSCLQCKKATAFTPGLHGLSTDPGYVCSGQLNAVSLWSTTLFWQSQCALVSLITLEITLFKQTLKVSSHRESKIVILKMLLHSVVHDELGKDKCSWNQKWTFKSNWNWIKLNFFECCKWRSKVWVTALQCEHTLKTTTVLSFAVKHSIITGKDQHLTCKRKVGNTLRFTVPC